MKFRKLSALLAITFYTFSSFAGENTPVTKVIAVSENYRQLEITGNISVMITSGANTPSIMVYGNSKDISRIHAEVKNGKLFIDARRKNSLKKVIVAVPESFLQNIVVNGDAEIFSRSKLNIESLSITLNGISQVNLETSGKVVIKAADGYELEKP